MSTEEVSMETHRMLLLEETCKVRVLGDEGTRYYSADDEVERFPTLGLLSFNSHIAVHVMIRSVVLPLLDHHRTGQALRAIRTDDNIPGQNIPGRQLNSPLLGIDPGDFNTQPDFRAICDGDIVEELPQVGVLDRA